MGDNGWSLDPRSKVLYVLKNKCFLPIAELDVCVHLHCRGLSNTNYKGPLVQRIKRMIQKGK